MAKVLVDNLNVRTAPSTGAQSVAKYQKGDIINSADALVEGDGRIWLRYTGGSGNKRFVCAYNNDGSVYIDVPGNIPGPRPDNGQKKSTNYSDSGWLLTAYCSCSKCCGKSNGITACGYQLKDSDHLQVCAAPKEIPFHTIIKISGAVYNIVL